MALDRIRVSLASQKLAGYRQNELVCLYPVSTALKGAGEREGSGCTPRGRHRIRARIGAEQPRAAVFVGRRPTGEIWSPELASQQPQRDWILSRILWLTGCEPGINRGGAVDTLRRYIYIHGCPDDCPMGVPRSHGCVRMTNADVIDLFDRVVAGTRVCIHSTQTPGLMEGAAP